MTDKALMLTQVAAQFYLDRPRSDRVGQWAYTMDHAARDATNLYRAVSDALREEGPKTREVPACTCPRGGPFYATTEERDCPRHADRSTGEGDER